MKGLFPWLRELFFGPPPAVPTANSAATADRPECAVSYCGSFADPRCKGGNCTQHCASCIGCNGICIKAASDVRVAKSGNVIRFVDGGRGPYEPDGGPDGPAA